MTIAINTLPKRAAESRRYTADFSNFPEIAGGETIQSIASVTVRKGGAISMEVAVGATAIVGTTATAWLSGGLANADYAVEFLVVTSAGSILEIVGTLSVLPY